MNSLIKKENDFLRLLLTTSDKQRKALLQTIERSQLRAIVQIAYNLLVGYHPLPEKDKKKLEKRKDVIRQFVSRGISLKTRKALLLKYYKYILLFINAIKGQLFHYGKRTGARTKKQI